MRRRRFPDEFEVRLLKNVVVTFPLVELNSLPIRCQAVFNLKRISEILCKLIFRKDSTLPQKRRENRAVTRTNGYVTQIWRNSNVWNLSTKLVESRMHTFVFISWRRNQKRRKKIKEKEQIKNELFQSSHGDVMQTYILFVFFSVHILQYRRRR